MKIEGIAIKENKDKNMNNNFLLINLEEEKTKKIAEVINNDTARKILDYLAKKDATESEISKDLGIAMSTAHYNLKQLEEANLIVVEEFHYSKKGKEVNHYTLANKFIIIAPKSGNTKFLEALQKILPLAIITVVAGALLTIYNFFTKSAALASLNAAPKAADAGLRTMAAVAPQAASAGGGAAEVSRPLLQSGFVVWFLIGALSIIIIYFLYEWMRKR